MHWNVITLSPQPSQSTIKRLGMFLLYCGRDLLNDSPANWQGTFLNAYTSIPINNEGIFGIDSISRQLPGIKKLLQRLSER
jgi:hypothetical protein